MYVVAGVTGHTGRVVAEALLERKQPVRVIVRDRAQGAAWEARGANVAVASLDDPSKLAAALSGATAAYFLVPPRYDADDMLATQRGIVDAIAEAVKTSRVLHVVLLSSVGGQHAAGTGPVRALHYAEQALGKVAKHLTVLRACYFLENWGAVLPQAQSTGVLYSFLTPGRKLPMVATQDIGRVAAEALPDASAGRLIELGGPEDWAPEDIARELSVVLGRDVRVQGMPLDAVVPTFTSAGMSERTAKLFEEMIDALNHDRMEPEQGRAKLRRGSIRPRDALKPLLAHTTA